MYRLPHNYFSHLAEKLGAFSVVDVHVFEGFSEDSKEKMIVSQKILCSQGYARI